MKKGIKKKIRKLFDKNKKVDNRPKSVKNKEVKIRKEQPAAKEIIIDPNRYVPPKGVQELQELIGKKKEFARKVAFQHNKRLIPMLRDEDKELTAEQIDDIYRFWDKKTNGLYRPDVGWHQFYYARTGIEDPRFIDNCFHYYFYVDIFNDTKYTSYKDKNYLSKLFPEVHQAKTIAMNICGYYYDANYEMIDQEAFIQLCAEYPGEMVIKPSRGTSGGVGVEFLHANITREEVEQALKPYHKNFIVQQAIKQHPDLAAISPKSINTIRLMTYLVNGTVRPLSAVLRMGIGEARVDNLSFGGIACGIDASGRCTKYAIDKMGNMYEKHPSGCVFLGTKIPSYNKVLKMADTMHKKLPMFGTIAWDITVDEQGEPVLIEFNTWYAQLALHQVSNGPIFGDSFDEIVDMIMKKAFVVVDQDPFELKVYKDYARIQEIKCKKGSSRKVVIPDIIAERPVISVEAKAAQKQKNLKEVFIGENVTHIRKRAFANCSMLEKVFIGVKTSSIAPDAFVGCKKLTICGEKDSYAHLYAIEHEIPFEVKDSMVD